jgi:ketosteroid isomerase-like protein
MSHTSDEILQAEEQLRQALLTDDVQALAQLLHDDLVFTDQTGIVVGKQDDLNSHASGALKMIEYEILETIVRLYGEIAIAVVKEHLSVIVQETPVSGDYRYTRIWLFDQGRWQIVGGQFGPVA